MGDASARAFSSVHDVYDFKDLKHVVDVGGGDGTNAIELTVGAWTFLIPDGFSK
jgi:hypothetical protein